MPSPKLLLSTNTYKFLCALEQVKSLAQSQWFDPILACSVPFVDQRTINVGAICQRCNYSRWSTRWVRNLLPAKGSWAFITTVALSAYLRCLQRTWLRNPKTIHRDHGSTLPIPLAIHANRDSRVSPYFTLFSTKCANVTNTVIRYMSSVTVCPIYWPMSNSLLWLWTRVIPIANVNIKWR